MSSVVNNVGRSPACHVCLSGINCTRDIFVARCSDGETLASALVACARVQISIDDGLPSVVCDKCADDVETFLRLRRRCRETNAVLRSRALDTSLPIKTEIADDRSTVYSPATKPFECEPCRKSFANKPNLLRYVRSHSGERPFECAVCSKSFALKHHLYEHVRIHSGDRPFECRVCAKTFSRKSHLVRHSRAHHAD